MNEREKWEDQLGSAKNDLIPFSNTTWKQFISNLLAEKDERIRELEDKLKNEFEFNKWSTQQHGIKNNEIDCVRNEIAVKIVELSELKKRNEELENQLKNKDGILEGFNFALKELKQKLSEARKETLDMIEKEFCDECETLKCSDCFFKKCLEKVRENKKSS